MEYLPDKKISSPWFGQLDFCNWGFSLTLRIKRKTNSDEKKPGASNYLHQGLGMNTVFTNPLLQVQQRYEKAECPLHYRMLLKVTSLITSFKT